MPISAATLFRALIMLVLAGHVFFMYSLARTMNGGFGFDIATTIVAALFGLAMLLPFVWAVAVPELPEIYTHHVRSRRWWKRGRCAACGYPRGDDRISPCPECGAPRKEPAMYGVTPRTVRRFVVLNLLAWFLGCGSAEAWIGTDEIAFRHEAQRESARGHSEYARQRRWPTAGYFVWDDEAGLGTARGGTGDVTSGAAAPVGGQ